MSDKIKPSEVSEVLLKQLQGISNSEDFNEVGTVLTVSDGVARIYGLRISMVFAMRKPANFLSLRTALWLL